MSLTEEDEIGRLTSAILERLFKDVGKNRAVATPRDWLIATSLVIRDHAIDHWLESISKVHADGGKRVYYLSLEFLIGRLMRDAACNLGILNPLRAALASLDVDIDLIAVLEPDAALGNGGLGRLAACYAESMATLGIPAYGYGIRYANGLFRQEIEDGWQIERPETWLAHGNPWEFDRPEVCYEIGFGGTVEPLPTETNGGEQRLWKPIERVTATAYDTPIVGWRGAHANTLRLWDARPIDPLILDVFNAGDHIGALKDVNKAESLTRILYPPDSNEAGQELRLRQEYFFSSASLQDILRRHVMQFGDVRTLHEKAAIQLNDTHPSIAIVELVRLLIDMHGLDFDEAWQITRQTFSYTNHTLLPEALESWPVPMFGRLLPRHMQLIHLMNASLLAEARRAGMDDNGVQAISMIDEKHGRRVRMANLAFAGSYSVNGVAAMHTDLMKKTVFADLHRLFPDRINNKTNGITPRRWLMQCNPGLAGLIREGIGDAFMDDAEALAGLNALAGDAAFQDRFRAVKEANKVALSNLLRERIGLRVDPTVMFDVHIKRIHEYKRQLLNIIETVSLYNRIRAHPEVDWQPRLKLFAGKSAASYQNAKLIIKLANDVARAINHDPAIMGLLKVAFVPDYNVSMAEMIVPAADLSEQISTAGMEASGTGNMKLALNGALTIGTLDGANTEILGRVGAENIIMFGLSAQEVAARRAGPYEPRAMIESSRELSQALAAIAGGNFSPDRPDRYARLIGEIYDHDWFMLAADFDSYSAAQRTVDGIWQDRARWNAMAIRNTANVGWFSSDRAVRQYASEIWQVPCQPVGG